MEEWIRIEDVTPLSPQEISARFRSRGAPFSKEVEERVREIVDDVARRGDEALVEYTLRFDGVRLFSPAAGPAGRGPSGAGAPGAPGAERAIRVSGREIEEGARGVDPGVSRALDVAIDRVRRFHERETCGGWTFADEHGNRIGKKVTPLERVGIYIPGGKASYPSTLVMTAVPARVAGVGEIALVSPPSSYEAPSPLAVAAGKVAAVGPTSAADGRAAARGGGGNGEGFEMFRVGGVQAVAALALGTESIRRVDKIVGPGNVYVAAAKRILYGTVDIDMIAGPSEVLILADGAVDPALAAVDLMAQAEHDENARAILVTWSTAHAERVRDALGALLCSSKRRDTVEKALRGRGGIYVVRDERCALAFANAVAPEHLEIQTGDPARLLEGVRHAGAVFLGGNAAEAFGDYLAGPSHVLPTSGTARFFSPLSVLAFLKFTSVIEISGRGLEALGGHAAALAEAEGLFEHARSVGLRLKKDETDGR